MRLTGNMLLATLLAAAGSLLAGCQAGGKYEVWQADHWRDPGFQPRDVRRAAIVMFAPWSEVGGEKIEVHGRDTTLQRNKTYAEALIISLQQRGLRIVEQQVFDAAQQEARLILLKQADVISTKELANRLGRQLNLDTIFYADALARHTAFEFGPKWPFAKRDEAYARQREANQRGGISPEDARRCTILVHHTVGLTLRAVDVTTGRITWVGYRHLALADRYDDDHPDVLSTFGAVQELAEAVVDDLLTGEGGYRMSRR